MKKVIFIVYNSFFIKNIGLYRDYNAIKAFSAL
jgi:hypothetical protein